MKPTWRSIESYQGAYPGEIGAWKGINWVMKKFHKEGCNKPDNHDGDCLDNDFEQYQILVRSAGGPGKINVYVVELDGAEWIKRKVLEQCLRPGGVRSRLVKRYWIVAKAVYDGRTSRASGPQAKGAAAALLARLRRGEPWKNRVDPIGQYRMVERRSDGKYQEG